MSKRLGISAAAIILAGCATSTGVLPVGKDTFQITSELHQIYGGRVAVQKQAVSQANDHCTSLDQEFVFINSSNQMVGEIVTYELTFRCVPPGDPEDVRPNIVIKD